MRADAIDRLASLVPSWPDLPFHDRGEGGLAAAIVLESIRRWRCAEWLVGCAAEREAGSLEAPLRAALMSAVAQIAFMDEPAHAVVNETVEWTKRRIRPGAGRITNAVLRRIVGWLAERMPRPLDWWRRRDLLLRADGSAVRLDGPRLPEDFAERLAIDSSHSTALVRRWIERHGEPTAAAIAAHGVMQPPRLVADPRSFLRDSPHAAPHRDPGFAVWTGAFAELSAALGRDASLRVQDPGSARAVARTAGLAPRLIVDACAGRGTKTRQCAELHPNAQIVAGDRDAERARALETAFRGHPRVSVKSSREILELRGVDLLILDVPCSNSGVLARRPEAKARFDSKRLASLVELQARIVESHLPLLSPGGRVLYATCSLEPEENEAIVPLLERRLGRAASIETLRPTGLPGDDPAEYRDGGGSILL